MQTCQKGLEHNLDRLISCNQVTWLVCCIHSQTCEIISGENLCVEEVQSGWIFPGSGSMFSCNGSSSTDCIEFTFLGSILLLDELRSDTLDELHNLLKMVLGLPG